MEFTEKWSFAEAASWVRDKGLKKVALQLADSHLGESAGIAAAFQEECSRAGAACSSFLLADSLYNPLDSDEVAASHASADGIVHLGRASMAAVSTLPTYFCFGKEPLDIPSAAALIAARLNAQNPSQGARAIIFLDQPLLWASAGLRDALQKALNVSPTPAGIELVFAEPPSRELLPSRGPRGAAAAAAGRAGGECCGGVPSTSASPAPAAAAEGASEGCCGTPASCGGGPAAAAGAGRDNGPAAGGQGGLGGYRWHGWERALHGDEKGTEAPSTPPPSELFLWVGSDAAPALQELQLSVRCDTWVVHAVSDRGDVAGGEEGLSGETQRLLKRRYFLVEKARTANVLGLLVGTLAVAGFTEAVARLRRLAEAAGKKTYTVVMGRPAPHKLANFPEIEVWVHVASPSGIILESRDFLSPIITPYEAEIALRDLDWPDRYRLTLDPVPDPAGDAGGAAKSDSPRFSLLTGSALPSGGSSGAAGSDLDKDKGKDTSDALVALSDRALRLRDAARGGAVVEVRTAADYLLARRTWQGVETPGTGAEVVEAERAAEGRMGRAAVFEGEGGRRER